jgi:sugar phosphate permease
MILEVAGNSLARTSPPRGCAAPTLALFGSCFGAAYGVSPIVAGALLQAGLPHLIWTVQLVAAGLAAFGLLALAALGRRRSVPDA